MVGKGFPLRLPPAPAQMASGMLLTLSPLALTRRPAPVQLKWCVSWGDKSPCHSGGDTVPFSRRSALEAAFNP